MALEESAALQEKVLLATECQKLADVQEKEMEAVIHGLELQIKDLTEREAKQMVRI